MQRFIVIGLGGTGGAVVRSAYVDIQRRLTRAGWDQGMPAAFQFSHIDVRQRVDVRVPGDPVELDTAPLFNGLARFPNSYNHYDSAASGQPGDPIAPAMIGWRPIPGLVTTKPPEGAGQRRAIGQVVGLAEVRRIQQIITRSASLASTGDAGSQLGAVSRSLGYAKAEQQSGFVVLVGSMAGGAGSGLFHTVVDVLQSTATGQDAWLGNILAFHVTPDVFLNDETNLRSNSLGYMNELLAGWEQLGGMTEKEAALFNRLGVAPANGRRSPAYNFLVGDTTKNGQSIGSTADVYTTLGRTVAAIASNDEVQTSFFAGPITNWQGGADQLALSPQANKNNLFPFKAVGSSVIGVGNRSFERYLVERLARRVIETITEISPTQGLSPQRAMQQMVQQERESFFDRCGLHEIGEKNNQIKDALRSLERRNSGWAVKRTALSDALAKRVGEMADGDERSTVFLNIFNQLKQEFVEEQRSEAVTAAQNWTAAIQYRIRIAIADSLGTFGGAVTLRLLAELDGQLKVASQELHEESYKTSDTSLLRLQSLLSKVRDLGGGHGWTSSTIKQVTSDDVARGSATLQFESEVSAIAASLVDGIRSSLLPSMRSAVEGGLERLQNLDQREEQAIRTWPAVGTGVPARLRPAPNEFPLLAADDYESIYDQLLAKTFETPAAEDAEARAVREIVTGIWPRRGDLETRSEDLLFEQRSMWQPERADLRHGNGSRPQSARLSADMSPDKLVEKTVEWARGRAGALSNQLRMTLQNHLAEPSQADINQFADMFGQALNMAAPLAEIDNATLQAIHGRADAALLYTFPALPVVSTSPLGTRLRAVLAEFDLPQKTIDESFDGAGDAEELEILSVFKESVHPAVFKTYNDGVRQSWNTNAAIQGGAESWWAYARARTLTAAIPLSQERVEATTRGWFLALIFGLTALDSTLGRKHNAPITIHIDATRRAGHGQTTLAFPSPLLSSRPPKDRKDVLPALLESYGLALLDVSNSDHDALWAYQELEKLGGDEGQAVISSWVSSGSSAADAPTPSPRFAGRPDDSPAERAEALQMTIRGQRDAYLEVRDEASRASVRDESTLRPIHELAEEVVLSLEQLGRWVEAAWPGQEQHDDDLT